MLHPAWFITELFGCASKIQTALLEAKWTRQVKKKKGMKVTPPLVAVKNMV